MICWQQFRSINQIAWHMTAEKYQRRFYYLCQMTWEQRWLRAVRNKNCWNVDITKTAVMTTVVTWDWDKQQWNPTLQEQKSQQTFSAATLTRNELCYQVLHTASLCCGHGVHKTTKARQSLNKTTTAWHSVPSSQNTSNICMACLTAYTHPSVISHYICTKSTFKSECTAIKSS